MEAIAETLESKLHQWTPATSQKVREMVAEIIALADDDALETGCTRPAEPEAQDLHDERTLGREFPEALSKIAEAVEKSKYILALPPNWDGEGSAAYETSVWERAAEFVLRNALQLWRVQRVRAAAPAIHNGPEGSIDIHWKVGARQLLVNVPAEPEGAATFYGSNPETGMETRGKLDTSAANEWLLLWITAK